MLNIFKQQNFLPVTSLLSAIILSFTVALLTSLLACCMAMIVFLIILALSSIPCQKFFKRFLAVNFFIFIMWLIVPFAAPAPNIHLFNFFPLSQAGLCTCFLVTLKANTILIIFTWLLSPLSMFQLGNALYSLHCPDKLAWLFLLMERNVALLQRERHKLHEAMQLHGFIPHFSLYSYKIMATMIGLLLLQAYNRGKILWEAMLLAGFTGRIPFSQPLRFTKNDVFLGVMVMVFILAIIGANFYL